MDKEIRDEIIKIKEIIQDHHLETLRKYRQCGQIILEGGYRKGRWNSGIHRWALQEWAISQQTFSRFIQLGEMADEEFTHVMRNFKSLDAWANQLKKLAHVGQATGESEWYTPEIYINAAREVMGEIDVDPASTDIANQIIQAAKYYTIEDDGLSQKWEGNVWMNPPYSQPLISDFCDLLIKKYEIGEVKQACVLVNNATETTFYQNMMNNCKAICFIKGRVKFIDKFGAQSGAPLQGQTILYFGNNPDAFGLIFSQFGAVFYAKN